jgi:hypothetical protein
MAVPYFRRLVAGFTPRRPGFELWSCYVGFVVDKTPLRQDSSEYFGFPFQTFHWLLHAHHHLSSSGAGYSGPFGGLTKVSSVSLHPEETKESVVVVPHLVSKTVNLLIAVRKIKFLFEVSKWNFLPLLLLLNALYINVCDLCCVVEVTVGKHVHHWWHSVACTTFNIWCVVLFQVSGIHIVVACLRVWRRKPK